MVANELEQHRSKKLSAIIVISYFLDFSKSVANEKLLIKR
jgi:hypothetical protein